ncbi:OLC1v1036133C9 [Oldenlandia corymbosa var. corymbosa]|uniref:L-dopachrome isomerase n=1 Tax=Oldenlandia corymbosa var. corymbosa TaxID=529605 RepID=A0AAV1CW08_OLDCO|nr:OLC1v1036133C9 [Oldenlandia corymbosa var. corymbosa]
MPTLNLFTNVPVDSVVTSDFLKDASKAVAKIIGKPESYVMIVLNGAVPVTFAGTEEPAAYGELISIGGLGPSVNGKLSSAIAEILQTKFSIDSSRVYIKFYDVEVNQLPLICLLLCLSKHNQELHVFASDLASLKTLIYWLLMSSQSSLTQKTETEKSMFPVHFCFTLVAWFSFSPLSDMVTASNEKRHTQSRFQLLCNCTLIFVYFLELVLV